MTQPNERRRAIRLDRPAAIPAPLPPHRRRAIRLDDEPPAPEPQPGPEPISVASALEGYEPDFDAPRFVLVNGLPRDIETLTDQTLVSVLEHHIDTIGPVRHLLARIPVTPESSLIRAEIDRLFAELDEGLPPLAQR